MTSPVYFIYSRNLNVLNMISSITKNIADFVRYLYNKIFSVFSQLQNIVYHCVVVWFSSNYRATVNMAGDPERRMRKVMFEVLSKAARYSDVLQIRHFVCDCGVRRTTRKGDFLLKRKALWLSEEKIHPTGYRWRIDSDCPKRLCVVKARTSLAFGWKVIGSYS